MSLLSKRTCPFWVKGHVTLGASNGGWVNCVTVLVVDGLHACVARRIPVERRSLARVLIYKGCTVQMRITSQPQPWCISTRSGRFTLHAAAGLYLLSHAGESPQLIGRVETTLFPLLGICDTQNERMNLFPPQQWGFVIYFFPFSRRVCAAGD